jgi:hypothetical protein
MHAVRLLRPGGLLIVQSYGYGIDVRYHADFLPAMNRQLAGSRGALLEAYRFTRTTGINLFVAQKRGGVRPSLRAPLTCIHGRAAETEPVEQTWP